MQTEKLLEERSRRLKWFQEARFGMFIHWGLYAISGRGEWDRSYRELSDEDYRQYFEEWNPVRYDPKEWAALAKEAGMKYAVLTTKHHDGFCLFDSKYTDFKSVNTPCGRDLVREYVDAFREAGIKIGFYFSLLDWHHPDYPAYGDAQHPMRNNPAWKDKEHNFDNYLTFMHNQVEELMTNYGKIDIIWFDFSYGDFTGEKWKAAELVEMIRRHQPDILINGRLEGSGEKYGSILTDEPCVYSGDFTCPEKIIPPYGLRTPSGNAVPWEANYTMNNSWGYVPNDLFYKSSDTLVKKLVECVSKGGNMLLNVGPTAKGEIPPKQVEILKGIGKWMRENSDSIYGCGISEFEKPEWGRYTQRGNMLYAHIMEKCIGPVPLRGLKGRIKKARRLWDGVEVPLMDPWIGKEYPDCQFVNFGDDEGGTYDIVESPDVVMEIELND